MMHSVASGAVDDGGVGDILAIVNKNCPAIDEDEKNHVCEFVERE
jgi:hypothetical protein